jgi:hypothetical protein
VELSSSGRKTDFHSVKRRSIRRSSTKIGLTDDLRDGTSGADHHGSAVYPVGDRSHYFTKRGAGCPAGNELQRGRFVCVVHDVWKGNFTISMRGVRSMVGLVALDDLTLVRFQNSLPLACRLTLGPLPLEQLI